MEKKGAILIIVGIIVIGGGVIFYAIGPGGEDDSSSGDNEIPVACSEFGNDVCGLFECMVDSCWCDSSPDVILYEQEGVSLNTTEAVIDYAKEYTNSNALSQDVINAVKLNNLFYNVFAEDSDGSEIVYTLATDGTIIKTVCGV